MEVTINGNITIGTKVDVASGATYIHTRIDKVDNYTHSELPDEGAKPTADIARSIPKERIKESLSSFFGMGFKGRNTYKVDYLSLLVDDLLTYQLPKDHARIANMIYNSKEMINRPSSFAAWYKYFCKACGCSHKKYDQNKVDDYEFLKKRFYYLTF